MSQPSLVEQIGRQGDRLFAKPLPEGDADGPVPLLEPGKPFWSLTYWSTYKLDAGDNSGDGLGFLFLVPLFPFMILIDFVHLLLRAVIYLPVQALWLVDGWLARWANRRWFCAACHHAMTEPWPCCPEPDCGRPVQTRLRPTFHNLFFKVCPSCRQSRWFIFSRWLGKPSPLVCRHTADTSGCYRVLRIPGLAEGTPVRHIALAGTTVAVKHAALTYLLSAWESAGFKPAWDVSGLEIKLAKAILGRAFEVDTTPAERPGRVWTLASTLLLERKRRRLALHNLLNEWLTRTEDLARDSCNWKAVDCLVFAVDGVKLVETPAYDAVTAAEYFSRLVRVAEEYHALPAGDPLPFRVVVLLVWPEDGAEATPSPESIEARLMKYDPALIALLRRMVGASRLSYFGGTVPTRGRQAVPEWARTAGEALL